MLDSVNTRKLYFGAQNTTLGFVNHFDDIFDSKVLNKIYIIKGGPGTGKSRMIKSIGDYSKSCGNEVEYFLCSSDPDSYDGVLIKNKGIAILDGTSPHTSEPKYPGAVEKIIYTGVCWNEDKLHLYKNEIIELISKKQSAYKKAYAMLSVYKTFADEMQKILSESMKTDKEDKCIKRICDTVFSKDIHGEEEIRIINAINHKGKTKLDTFEKDAENIIIVEEKYFTEFKFMEKLYNAAKDAHQKMTVSFSNIYPYIPEAIYFEATKTYVTFGKRDYLSEDCKKNYKYINMERFIDKNTLKDNKNKLKFYSKCQKDIFNCSIEDFKESYIYHSLLESYYIKSMDFTKLGVIIQDIIDEIK